MKKKDEEDRMSLRDMASAELVEDFCRLYEPCINEMSADVVMYDVDLREFFGCLFQAYQRTGVDLLNGYKVLLSEHDFLQQVSYDGRPCYYLRIRGREDKE